MEWKNSKKKLNQATNAHVILLVLRVSMDDPGDLTLGDIGMSPLQKY